MLILLSVTFTAIVLITYIVLNYTFVERRPINRIYTYIGNQEIRKPGNLRKKKSKTKAMEKMGESIKRLKQRIAKNNMKKTKYFKKFNDQLGDAIIIISNSLKAGHSFAQALGNLVQEMPDPVSIEFSKVVKEVKLGKTLESSLDNLLERMPSKDLELMITAILIQRETGGNLSEVLDIISETIRERIKIQGEIRTLTAQGKMSAIVVSLLPVALTGVLFVMSPEYIGSLFTNIFGIIMVIMGVILELIGIWFISKIIKVDV